MLKFVVFLTLALVSAGLVASHPSAKSGLVKEEYMLDEIDTKLAPCGGTIESDSDFLNYPNSDHQLLPGEVCVWTIHLNTTSNFKFNFTSLDVNSNNADCSDGGVRIYSLTNLVPSDRLESYTFCDQMPSTGSFFLGQNVAVVVLYVGSSNNRPGLGFTLGWEGSSFDARQTKHISSFSSASNGIVRYPVIGRYEPNLAATWLLKSVSFQQTTKSDLNFDSLSFETCGNPDPCTCDALILYEISPQGLVNETKRFCGESSGGFLQDVESRFILAFFTDFNAQPIGGRGFQVTYYQTGEETTAEPTTTTTTTTEATTQKPPIITPCGRLLGAKNGTIEYKNDQTYDPNERCMWTIRIPDASRITFNLVSTGVTSDDGIVVSTFKRNSGNTPLQENVHLRGNTTGPVTLTGGVAIVMFYSDASAQSTGFILNYQGEGSNQENSIYSKDRIVESDSNIVQRIAHPTSGSYDNYELTTVLIAPPRYNYNEEAFEVTYTKRGIEDRCLDSIYVLKFQYATGWVHEARYCDEIVSDNRSFNDVPLYVFTSDQSKVHSGFHLDYAMN